MATKTKQQSAAPLGPTSAPDPPERRRLCGRLVHLAAELLPEPSPEEYARLKDDIKKHGIRVPIVLLKGPSREFEILDGRSRARALEELYPNEDLGPEDFVNATPVAETNILPGGTSDPVAYVLSLNAARRHLRPEQVAAIYIAAHEEQIKAQQVKAAAARQAGRPSGTDAPRSAVAPAIAKATGVGERTVKKVLAVAKAAPEKVKDIAKGKTSANKVLKVARKRPDTADAVAAETNEQKFARHVMEAIPLLEEAHKALYAVYEDHKALQREGVNLIRQNSINLHMGEFKALSKGLADLYPHIFETPSRRSPAAPEAATAGAHGNDPDTVDAVAVRRLPEAGRAS